MRGCRSQLSPHTTSTKVHILTLYWYKSTHTDTCGPQRNARLSKPTASAFSRRRSRRYVAVAYVSIRRRMRRLAATLRRARSSSHVHVCYCYIRRRMLTYAHHAQARSNIEAGKKLESRPRMLLLHTQTYADVCSSCAGSQQH